VSIARALPRTEGAKMVVTLQDARFLRHGEMNLDLDNTNPSLTAFEYPEPENKAGVVLYAPALRSGAAAAPWSSRRGLLVQEHPDVRRAKPGHAERGPWRVCVRWEGRAVPHECRA